MNTKELASSLALILIGGTFVASSLLTLDMGTTFKMGPGYFPLVLASLVILIGFVLFVSALTGQGSFKVEVAPARAVLAIILAPILFGLTVRGAGFIPAVAVATLSASLASPDLNLKPIIVISFGMTAFCVAVFIYGLGMPVRLIGPWLGA
ncbi:tripartite tricarboxylate transporter TctB family protein (plasmid) [Agrobacterium tumefaciens]|uniref:Tripartite tricarboxylate transporter TctB family protein n=1 Tax=Agrobacterium tumefaciens TaxID=358 RepID=A0AAJ4TDC7_AGRTU|nr:tripartite tricarboxylate transporter TctB family protein [Agrobacterium tumefaciens]